MGSCCSSDAAAASNANTNHQNPVAAEKSLDEAEKVPMIASDRACFGAGCYWGTEKFFYHDFGKKNTTGAITDAAVGFMGPDDAPVDPTYAEVKGGYTKHVEVFEFEYSGGLPYYEALVRFFFQFHDPTTLKRQGNDVGTQYASVIYCYDDAQMEVANKVKAELQSLIDAGKITCFENKAVTTDIRKATKFYPAHKEHQDYLTVNPDGYCNHRMRFAAWPKLDDAQ
jgi:peptide-methionine (S)-S-oxide reductase